MENITIIKRLSAEDRTIATAKPSLRCYRCQTIYHYRIKRHWFVKYVLFFLPVKIYFCGHCVKERYILLTDKGETKYRPV